MRPLWLTLLLCTIGLAWASPAQATVTVSLRDGSQVRGTLVDVEVQFVTVRTPTGDRSIDLSAVRQIVTADGSVVYQGHAVEAAPTALPVPSPGPALTPPPAASQPGGPAATETGPPSGPSPVATVPAMAPAPVSVPPTAAVLPVPAAPSAPLPANPDLITRRHWGLALDFSGGCLAAAATALTLASVNQTDGSAKNSLGSAAAITGGSGLLAMIVGALILPHATF